MSAVFHHLSDELRARGFSLRTQATAFGVKPQTFRAWRLKPEAKGYRSPGPPMAWRAPFLRMIDEREAALERLARELETNTPPPETPPA